MANDEALSKDRVGSAAGAYEFMSCRVAIIPGLLCCNPERLSLSGCAANQDDCVVCADERHHRVMPPTRTFRAKAKGEKEVVVIVGFLFDASHWTPLEHSMLFFLLLRLWTQGDWLLC